MTTTLDSNTLAQYLTDNPRFFEEHAGLLGTIKLSSPLTGRAVSLQERQMEIMREKYKVLELRMAELIRLAHDNAAIAAKLHAWTDALLQTRNDADLPQTLIDVLITGFDVPHATLRLWNVTPSHADAWFVQDVSDDAKMFANSLQAPYCGSNHDFEALHWLGDGASVASTVILPLRTPGTTGAAFGLLILGSSDPERFAATMATDFLIDLGTTASAALSRLQA